MSPIRDFIFVFQSEISLRTLFTLIAVLAWAVVVVLLCCVCLVPCRVFRTFKQRKHSKWKNEPMNMSTLLKMIRSSTNQKHSNAVDEENVNTNLSEDQSSLNENSQDEFDERDLSCFEKCYRKKLDFCFVLYSFIALFLILLLILSMFSYIVWWITGALSAIIVVITFLTIKWDIIENFKIEKNWRDGLFIFGSMFGLIGFSFFIAWALASICICQHPWAVSFQISRAFSGASCQKDTVCLAYLTAAEDMSSSVIVNFHANIDKPPRLAVAWIWRVDQSIDDGMAYEAKCSRIRAIKDENRFVCWADVTNLTAGVEYAAQPRIFDRRHKSHYLPISIENATDKVLQFELPDENKPFAFVAGGDYQVGPLAIELSNYAANQKLKPHFTLIGGDITYANALPACYRRWDIFLRQWYQTLRFTQIIASPGNHDSGQYFDAKKKNIPFYMAYFPQKLNLSNESPNFEDRTTYHSHRVGKTTMIVSIDTGVIEPIDSLDQLEFIRRELNASVAHALTLYHYGLYPGLSFVQQPEMKRITEKARRVLGPLFDAVPLSYSFENHYHVFKATKAILNDTSVGDSNSTKGVTYLGDGSWGIVGNNKATKHPLHHRQANANHLFYGVFQPQSNHSLLTVHSFNQTGEIFFTTSKSKKIP